MSDRELLKTYAQDVDLLLTEICLTAAMYGLDASVTAMADHLRDMPRTEGAALLAMALSKTAVRDYPQALTWADRVLNNPQMAALHAEATAFRQLALQLQQGRQPDALKPLG
jgi:hypothetical protein